MKGSLTYQRFLTLFSLKPGSLKRGRFKNSLPKRRLFRHSFFIIIIIASFCLGDLLDFSDQIEQYVAEKYGKRAGKRVANWHELMREYNAESDWDKLNRVNKFFNKLRWLDDKDHWQQRDYWATPVEMLATNGGDCEDYSIAKYFTLKELGIPESKLRITYVIALELNQAHMVLAYYETPGAEPLILDNIKNRVMPASSRPDLHPVYSFNGDGLWTAQARGTELKKDNSKNVKWNDLNARMLKEIQANSPS